MAYEFDRYVDDLAKKGAQRRLTVANMALQKSLRERSDEEVYEGLLRRLGAHKTKQSVVLA